MVKLTPPMGWNSWNTFGNNINEQLIFETADAMVKEGLPEKGYEYLVADPAKFPHGMKAVADYVHSKGLKFGMYSCAGNLTCAGYPGSFEHEFIDAETFASWAWITADAISCSPPAPGARTRPTSGSRPPARPCGAPPAIFSTPGSR